MLCAKECKIWVRLWLGKTASPRSRAAKTALQAQAHRHPPTDPLGRNEGQGGATGRETLLERDALRKRSQDLMDEIQRRQSELDRPDNERGYLKRLLEQF